MPMHHLNTLTSYPILMADLSVTRVSVRELCEFSARAGDLDLRFGMSPMRARAWPVIWS